MRSLTTMIETVASASPRLAGKYLARYNVPEATSMPDLITKIGRVVKAKGDEAMADLALIHPDREFIEAAYELRKQAETIPITFEACGCVGADAETTTVAKTTTAATPNKTFLATEIKIGNALLIGAVGLVAIALTIKILK